MRFSVVIVFTSSFLSAALGQVPSSRTSQPAVPTPSQVLPFESIERSWHVVQRNKVITPRNITIVKQHLSQQIGPMISPLTLTQSSDSRANYTATVNRNTPPSGLIHFLSIMHGRWFRLFGFADGGFVPGEMQVYTIGNPLILETFARYTIGAFLNAPIRLIVYETPTRGTVIEWEEPTSQLILPDAPLDAYRACLAQNQQVSRLVNYIAFGN